MTTNSKSYYLIIVVLLILQGQPIAQESYQIVFDKKYSELPFGIRFEYSGSYSAASFDVSGKDFLFSSFNDSKIYKFNNEKNQFILIAERGAINLQEELSSRQSQSDNRLENNYPELILKKIFKNELTLLKDRGGLLDGANGEQIKIVVEKNEALSIKVNIPEINFLRKISFPSNLACAELIGIDGNGNTFVIVETYLSQIPLEVKREVYALSKFGDVQSVLEIPLAKFIYTLRDLQIDADGNLYHLYSDEKGIKIFRWSGLTKSISTTVHYPAEFNKISLPKVLPNLSEPEQLITEINTPASRVTALKIGESYALHQYKCTSKNLSVSDVSAPDGDMVRTPSWLVVGSNARVAYKWGGFNTLAEYDAGLANEKFAADINTDGVSSYAVGVDCSGFVSRCWQMGSHYSTSSMPAITTQYASWNDLKPGDAIHKIGHVRLFINRNPNGTLRVVESSARGWDVSYWTYATSDLTTYTPRYYNNMEVNANSNQPNLLQAIENYGGIISLNWSCDTTNIIGYRVYHSVNGSTWSLLLDEKTCNSTSVNVGTQNEVEYFRIASVKMIGNEIVESNWSNSMGIKRTATPTCLIVDGYKRIDGSWRGAGHTFATKYGKALQDTKYNFETVSNSKVLDGTFQLNNFKVVIWISGDESTIDETFSHAEQNLLKSFLENGGSLFISGSEIGWDLGYKGDATDKDFYKNYFKANYVSDDAATNTVSGEQNSIFAGLEFYFGQTYEEDYPDVISPFGGSVACLRYSNGTSAGILFSGKFGSSDKIGKVIYLSFPLETISDDPAFKNVLTASMDFFGSPTAVNELGNKNPTAFYLGQNFPNPFNPSTVISYELPERCFVNLKVYDILGNEVATLVNEEKPAGIYQEEFSIKERPLTGVNASGIYYYRLTVNNFIQTKKMLYLK